ncbi:MAG TPA: hypothetical protein VK837_05930 [Longimicrobiales bacterium]|nr:hypothetical protein [Longimicrobiales bacterium]
MTSFERASRPRDRGVRTAPAPPSGRRSLAVTLLSIGGLASAGPVAAQHADAEDPVRAEVLAAAQALFDAMADRDSAAVADILLPEGGFYAVGTADGTPVHSYIPHAEFAPMVARAEAPLIERMWDAEVIVRDPIAMVWTPYDFHFGDTFSHCGVDAFSLVRTAEGWKVAGIIFTRETEDCPENPAGPVDGS